MHENVRSEERDDEELPRGEEIAAELLKAIDESRICLIILSENYARSRGGDIALGLLHAIEKSRLVLTILSDNYVRSSWCLDELVKIMKCRKEMRKFVFPVFHHVDLSLVRTQRGSYGR
ncbi:Disease resistance protein TAO1 [Vitis vinifera]|uniref:ADP-ribosyl cyclase/cyclic ADP-ribose hydrolase n=1 Tax=Vitis vinifera TaxID=29760 RepID=A0A438FXI3_VITVI|nr:Disease resistance protein TAO1 [Vitis vinifera]